jgi:hypothetical protein
MFAWSVKQPETPPSVSPKPNGRAGKITPCSTSIFKYLMDEIKKIKFKIKNKGREFWRF